MLTIKQSQNVNFFFFGGGGASNSNRWRTKMNKCDKMMEGHKVVTNSRNPYNGPGGSLRIIDGTVQVQGTGNVFLKT